MARSAGGDAAMASVLRMRTRRCRPSSRIGPASRRGTHPAALASVRVGRPVLVVWAFAMAMAPFGCDLDDSEPMPWTSLVLADGAVPSDSVDAGATAAWPQVHDLDLTGHTVLGYDPALLPLGPPHAPLRTRTSSSLDEQCARVGASAQACRVLPETHVRAHDVEAAVLVTSVAAPESDGSVERLDLVVRDASGWRVVARIAEVEAGASLAADVRIDPSAVRGPLVVAHARSEMRTLDHGWDEVTTIERATLVVAGDRGDGLEALAVVPTLERVRRAMGRARVAGPNVPPPVVSEEELGFRLEPTGRLTLWVARGRGELAHLAGEHDLFH